eukprot:s2129_g7.t1
MKALDFGGPWPDSPGQAEVEEAIEVLVEEELGMNPTFGEGAVAWDWEMLHMARFLRFRAQDVSQVEDFEAISAMTAMPTVTLAAPSPVPHPMRPMNPMGPMGSMGAMPMAPPMPVAFQPTLLVPVAMVMVNVPSPCSTPTSVPSHASSEMVFQGTLSRQSTGDTSADAELEPGVVAGCVWDLSQRHKGCRLVQQTLENCGETERAMLAQELKGHIVEASRSPCGNYVLQKLIQVLRPQSCQFIIHELMQDPAEVCGLARHQYGCRILQRLFENCQAEQMEGIVQMLLKEASALVCHSYGTYVMQQIFDFGSEMQRRNLCDVLLAGSQLCNDEHATQVLQKALQHAPQQVQLAQSMVQQLPQMARGRHSHQTVITAMQLLPEQESERAIGLLSQKINKLWASRYGRLVVKSIPKLYQQCSSMTRREAASA